MTARKPAKPPSGKTIAKKKQPETGWPGVIWHAIDSNEGTIRLCAIVLAVGVVFLLAVMLGLRFWL